MKETRAQAARRINDLYVNKKITREEWSVLFDTMSDLSKWGADGIIEAPKKGPHKA